MRAEVLKDFRSKGRDYKRGSMIEIDDKVFNKLSLMGLVRPFLSNSMNDEPEQKEVKNKEGLILEIIDRSCVGCCSKVWIILKPNSKVSAIQCVICNHIEIAVLSKNN